MNSPTSAARAVTAAMAAIGANGDGLSCPNSCENLRCTPTTRTPAEVVARDPRTAISHNPSRTLTTTSGTMTTVAVMAVRCQARAVRSGYSPAPLGKRVIDGAARQR